MNRRTFFAAVTSAVLAPAVAHKHVGASAADQKRLCGIIAREVKIAKAGQGYVIVLDEV